MEMKMLPFEQARERMEELFTTYGGFVIVTIATIHSVKGDVIRWRLCRHDVEDFFNIYVVMKPSMGIQRQTSDVFPLRGSWYGTPWHWHAFISRRITVGIHCPNGKNYTLPLSDGDPPT
jgi:hypothetical protein